MAAQRFWRPNACHHQAAEVFSHGCYPLVAALVMALLAVIYAVPPVPWVACMMSKCKDNYSIFIWSIHKRKRKVLEEHSPSFFRC